MKNQEVKAIATGPQSDSLIRYWNRKEGKEEVEQVYGEAALNWVYGTKLGQNLANMVLSKPGLSQIYGSYQSSRLSRHKIAPFIQEFKIPMEEYVEGPFHSFNDFFIRQFKPGARQFTRAKNEMAAFAEARYFAYDEVTPEVTVPVKGTYMSSAGLLKDEQYAQTFANGPLLLARLCPTDYHRFHFPDSGKILKSYRINGDLHSVNPMALKYKQDILMANERHVSIMETENFGLMAYIEVGALCVGKIVQTHTGSANFERGDEKGYFLFGGSTVIVLGQKGIWKPDADLVQNTQRGRETLVRLGERVATRSAAHHL